MTSERPSASREQVPVSDTRLEPATGADSRQRALALGLEFAKRAFESPAPDDLFLLLTNDIRVLLEFDRSFLITHIEGESRLVAVGNQTGVEKKSELTQQVRKLAAHLKDVQKGLLISGRTGTAALSDEDFSCPSNRGPPVLHGFFGVLLSVLRPSQSSWHADGPFGA
ncbi:MAG: hypothetical protein AB1733_15215 [Thermodesulfobacteriota bacterium]